MKVTVFLALSLDGFIARPSGELDWLDRIPAVPGNDYGYAALWQSIDCLVLGRKSVEKVLSFPSWPYTGKPVQVLSRTLRELPPALNGLAKLAPSLSEQELLRYWQQQGWHHIYLDGGVVVQSFLRQRLVNELILTWVPVLLGKGRPLFADLLRDQELELLQVQQFSNGLLQTHYQCR